MKIIFSRKGFDSASGGVPSPIFPDDRILSLPIPDKHSPILYQNIKWNEYNLGSIVSDLTDGRIKPHYGAHLDPDIDPQSLDRHREWKPLFGQIKAAQGHLKNQQVQTGDIFIFYGLFRRVALKNSHLCYVDTEPAVHIIWGWMQIEDVIPVDSWGGKELKWAGYHPHFHKKPDKTNTVYVATKDMFIHGIGSHQIKGAGTFNHYNIRLQLTLLGSNKASIWQLPEWMYPSNGKKPLTYHNHLKRWEKGKGYLLLNAVRRGQEFILDCSCYPESKEWLKEVLSH